MKDGTYETRRCTAHRTNGEPCRSFATHGGTVCRVHGGSAPQVKAAAAERLRELVDPAITALHGLLTAESEAARLGAARDVLDRNGYRPEQKVRLNGHLDIDVETLVLNRVDALHRIGVTATPEIVGDDVWDLSTIDASMACLDAEESSFTQTAPSPWPE